MDSRPLSRSWAIVCLLALGVAGCDRQSPVPVQANASADAVASDEAVSSPDPAPTPAGDRVDRSHRGEAAAVASFTAPDGRPVTLAAFRGTPVLLNLWATWCAPCVAEMPTLDAAAVTAGGRLAVLAVSQDLTGAEKVSPFFATARFRALKPYLDPAMALSLAYRANLPTTVLLDRDGREVWRVTGDRDWSDAASRALIAEGA